LQLAIENDMGLLDQESDEDTGAHQDQEDQGDSAEEQEDAAADIFKHTYVEILEDGKPAAHDAQAAEAAGRRGKQPPIIS